MINNKVNAANYHRSSSRLGTTGLEGDPLEFVQEAEF